jgi:hypothetical protein
MQSKKLLVTIILVGGVAVLGSYGLGILANPKAGSMLWSGVPQSIRPYYTVNMFLAASGYFAFTYFILFRLEPADTQTTHRYRYGLFNLLYSGILIPSALWLPLTVLAVEQSSIILSWVVRIALITVGLASLGLLFAILKVKTPQSFWARRLAVIGCVLFCLQTVVLDALVWGAFFRV